MNDGYIAAAHSHRVTLMVKDFVIVSRLRYKFDKALQPIPCTDHKVFQILNIPPARAPKKSSVVIEDISHQYPTRFATDLEEGKKQSKELELEEERFSEEQILLERIEVLKQENSIALQRVTGQIIVNVAMPWEKEENYMDISPEDSVMLREFNLELSDSFVNICLRYDSNSCE